MNSTMALISKDELDKDFVGRLADSSRVQKIESLDELDHMLTKNQNLSVFTEICDQDSFLSFEDKIKRITTFSLPKLSMNRVHYLLKKKELDKLSDYNVRPAGNNFIIRTDETSISQCAEYYTRVFENSVHNENTNFLDLFNTFVQSEVFHVQKYSDKKLFIEQIEKKLKELKCPPHISSIIALGTDELIMNAIFDAPRNSVGDPIHLNTDRTQDIVLDEKNKIQVSLAHDDKFIGISVKDLHGTLNRDSILRYLFKNIKKTPMPDSNTGGMGLGISMLFRFGASFFVNCTSGESTEISLLFIRSDSYVNFHKHLQFVAMNFK